MKTPSLLLLAAAVGWAAPALQAQDGPKIDATQTVDSLATTNQAVVPDKVETQKNDQLQQKQAVVPGTIKEPAAAIGDRQAPIDVTETHDKNMVTLKEAPKPELQPHVDSVLDGQQAPSRLQPGQNDYYNSALIDKYRQSMSDAEAIAQQSNAMSGQMTTFAKLNRFVFKRNGPGTEGNPMVVPAGSPGAPVTNVK